MQNSADPYAAADFFGMTLEILQRVYFHHHPDHHKGVGDALTGRTGWAEQTKIIDTERDGDAQQMQGFQRSPLIRDDGVGGSNPLTPTQFPEKFQEFI
jgi:hypothetical protein